MSSNKGLALRRRPVPLLALPPDDDPVRLIGPTPIQRVRQTIRDARELLPPDLLPFERFRQTRDLFLDGA